MIKGVIAGLGLRAKLALLAFLTVLGCVWGLAFGAAQMYRDEMVQVLADQQLSMVRLLSSNLDAGLGDRIKTLQTLADLVAKRPDLLKDGNALQEFVADHPAFYTLFNGGSLVLDAEGMCLAEYPETGRRGVDYRDRDYFQDTASGLPVVSRLVVGRTTGRPLFAISVPVLDGQGRRMAVLAGVTVLSQDNFVGVIKNSKLGKSGRFLLISPKDGKFVMASDDTPTFKDVPAPGINAMHDRYMGGFEGSGIAVNSKGSEELSSAVRIANAGWFLVAATPVEEAFAPIRKFERNSYLAAALASLLAGIMAWALTSRMLSPLDRMAAHMESMASEGAELRPLPKVEVAELDALVTGFNRLQDRLAAQDRQLVKSNADLEQFAYVISHDLRQPLRGITSYATLLMRKMGPSLEPDAAEMLGYVDSSARRMNEMLVSLLEYSRVGRMGEPMAPQPMRDVLDEALRFLHTSITENGAVVTVTGDWPVLAVSRNEMARLFQNLVGNAVKYRVPGQGVAVSVSVRRASASEWEFRVTDNGIGIDAAHLDRLFKVFQRLHTVREYEGTGIGLAICRRIVERHGGRIWVESDGEGKGCRFLFTLPV